MGKKRIMQVVIQFETVNEHPNEEKEVLFQTIEKVGEVLLCAYNEVPKDKPRLISGRVESQVVFQAQSWFEIASTEIGQNPCPDCNTNLMPGQEVCPGCGAYVGKS